MYDAPFIGQGGRWTWQILPINLDVRVESILREMLLMIIAFVLQSFLIGQIPVTASAEFSAAAQKAATLATVRLEVGSNSGSGTVVGKSGPHLYILTAAHVVDNKQNVRVALFNAESYPRPANIYESGVVIAFSAVKDLAVVRLATSDPPSGIVQLGDVKKMPKIGAVALVSGCLPGKAPICRVDQVSKKVLAKRTADDAPTLFWQMGERYEVGYSGGPTLDATGRLIGVCSGASENRSYFIHLLEVQAFLRQEGLNWLMEGK